MSANKKDDTAEHNPGAEVAATNPSQEKANLPLEDLVVQDGVIMLQLVDRLFKNGGVQGREALPVGILRQKISESLAKQGVTEQQG